LFIAWVGPDVKPLVKARSSQHRLALYNYMKNIVKVTAELQVLSQAEINLDVIHEKLSASRFKDT